jgi:signal transduction histidine kinase
MTPDGIPRLTRVRDGAVVGGVAAGIAAHLHLKVVWVRVAFAVMAVMAGAGILFYALLWIFVPLRGPNGAPPGTPSPAERRQAIGIAAVGVALLIAATALGFGRWIGWLVGPVGVVAIGAAFIWREADDARRARWRRTAAGVISPTRGTLWRILGGVILVVGGLSIFAIGQLDFAAARSVLFAVALTLVGVAVITVPWWIRLARDLGDERRGRVQERERAEIAAHLHDSVLQTLALIQRQAGDSREVQRLARGQERELRSWLYGPTGYAAPEGFTAPADTDSSGATTPTFTAALAGAAGEVEDTYAITVAPVVVGDAVMDPHLAALVAASREAMVNAAKHAGVAEISVYAEIENGTASVFVRDRGKGFDPDSVGADRRGLAQSIRGRMDRHGGTAAVRSAPGAGTEVVLTMPVTSAESGTARAQAHDETASSESSDPGEKRSEA